MPTILLVDDYAPNHRLMRFVLEQSGYATITVFDGQQALDQLANRSVDLIVTDLTMPTMDGLGLARQVRGDERFKGIPIIVVTANCNSRNQALATGIGINSFLTKPVASEEIVREIDRLIAGKEKALKFGETST